jgi:hypothetical protein
MDLKLNGAHQRLDYVDDVRYHRNYKEKKGNFNWGQ